MSAAVNSTFTTSTGQLLHGVHPETADCLLGCPIHAPTPHGMRDWPTHWRDDRLLMERICPHGVGHPDPDHLAHTARRRGERWARGEAIHGCDGCCGETG